MPRYYFDIEDPRGRHADMHGSEFVDLAEARDHAQALLGDLLSDELPDGDVVAVTCDVRDEAGDVVYTGRATLRGTPERGS